MIKITTRTILFLLLFSIPNTAFTFGILWGIKNAISGKNAGPIDNAGIFFSGIVLSYLLNILFQRRIISYSNQLIYKNELRIIEALVNTELRKLEALGSEKIYGIIEDLRMFVFLPTIITDTTTAVMTLLACMAYFLFISPISALVVLASVVITVLIYIYLSRRPAIKIERLRNLNDQYFRIIDDAIKGFKALKLSLTKRDNLLNKFLSPNRKLVRDLENNISNTFLAINLFSQYGLFVILGIILFILPYFNLLSKTEASSFIITLLFIRGPLSSIVAMQSFYTKAFVANRRIEQFVDKLKDIPFNEEEKRVIHKKGNESKISFENITYRYEDIDVSHSFQLGPINIDIEEGETVFIVGGNGSGKSTFVNLLTGLYQPTGGAIYLSGNNILADRQRYKDHIAAIYTDHHLFYHNYENYKVENNSEYRKFLQLMELDGILSDNQCAAPGSGLSKGQSKRMALIFALMENKPILILDEWAADQDPYFRKYFYEELIPELKTQGKTIIAITHDDAYFKHADRVIRFDNGKIVKDIPAREYSFNRDNIWSI